MLFLGFGNVVRKEYDLLRNFVVIFYENVLI